MREQRFSKLREPEVDEVWGGGKQWGEAIGVGV